VAPPTRRWSNVAVPRLRDRLAAARVGWRTGRSPWTAPTAARGRAAGAGRRRRLHPALQAPPATGRSGTVRDMVLTLFQGVTALTAVAAVLFTARSLDYTADATNATNAQVRLAERGQITERFGRAIDQLGQEGADKLSIRLGGIYALERVMRDSAADEPTVIEVLCAFIRTHAPRPDPLPARIPPSPPDVQAAVFVLGRRPDPDAVDNRQLHLAGTLLSLPAADLSFADLAFANLTFANLTNVYLTHANLTSANLSGADLTGGASLIFADLSFAHLPGANLNGAYLSDATLLEADLTDANLTGATLADVNLRGARLTEADLTGTDLTGADLTGVFGLTSAQLAGARVDERTRLPAGMVVPSPEPTG